MKPLSSATAELLKPVDTHCDDRLKLRIDPEGKYFWAKLTSASEFSDYASTYARRKWPLRVPERKELTGRIDEWNFAATDTTVAVILATWKEEQLIFEDEDTRMTFHFIQMQSVAYDQNVETVARYKASIEPVPFEDEHLTPELLVQSELPDFCRGTWQRNPVVPSGLKINEEVPLLPYQRVPVANALRSDGYGLLMATGTGKTPCVISLIDNMLPSVKGRMLRALVVCPNSLRTNWEEETHHFAMAKGKVTILRGGEINRIKLLIEALGVSDSRFTVVVVSYQTMVRMQEALSTIEWDLIALDEAHAVKWPTTKQSQAVIKLRDSAAKRVILTATPVGNTPLDLYNQLEFLGKGYSGFQSWKEFRSFYGVFDKDYSGRDKLVSVQNLPFLKERLSRYCYIISKKEALPFLPDKSYTIIETGMSPRQADIYEQVRDELVAKFERELEASETKSLIVTNMLTQLLRLAQITAGFVPWDAEFNDDGEQIKGREVTIFEQNYKIDAMIEAILSKEENRKSIVFCCWVPMIKEIERRMRLAGIEPVLIYGGIKQSDRDAAVNAFNNEPGVKVLLANQACAGAGLNLYGFPPHAPESVDTDCDQVFWYAQDWSLIKRAQSEDRNHRFKTRVPVVNTDLMTPGTIDKEIRDRVVKKRKTADFMSDIKDILKAVITGDFRNA